MKDIMDLMEKLHMTLIGVIHKGILIYLFHIGMIGLGMVINLIEVMLMIQMKQQRLLLVQLRYMQVIWL